MLPLWRATRLPRLPFEGIADGTIRDMAFLAVGRQTHIAVLNRASDYVFFFFPFSPFRLESGWISGMGWARLGARSFCFYGT